MYNILCQLICKKGQTEYITIGCTDRRGETHEVLSIKYYVIYRVCQERERDKRMRKQGQLTRIEQMITAMVITIIMACEVKINKKTGQRKSTNNNLLFSHFFHLPRIKVIIMI